MLEGKKMFYCFNAYLLKLLSSKLHEIGPLDDVTYVIHN
jgi:hypothetical protein